MPKSAVRGAVYEPSDDMMPYVGLVITPQGTQYMATFPDRAQAQAYVDKYRNSYLEQLSVVGRGIRSDSPSK